MKKVLSLLFLSFFIIAGIQAKTVTIEKKCFNFSATKKQKVSSLKVTNQDDASYFIRKISEEFIKVNTEKQICFVYLTDISFSESVDGSIYAILTIDIHCYGIPGQNDLTIFVN